MPPALLPFPRLLRRLRTRCSRPGRGPARWLPALLMTWLLSAPAWAQAPANDNPCGAIQLGLNGNLCITPTVGTNAGATTTAVNGTVANTCGAFNNPAPKDVWYKFTTDATGPGSAGATITVTGNPAGLLRLFSAPAGCTGAFTQISCSASNASNTAAPRLVTGALQPSTTYYVQVAGFTSTDAQGQFTICITDPPACGAPAVLGVTFPTGTSASVAFTAGPGNTTFTAVLQGGTGGQQTVNNVTSPVLFTGLTPGTTYFVTIRTDCGGNQLQSPFFSFTVPLLNDDPCGAIDLPVGASCAPTTGTTFGAGTTTPNGYTNPGCAADPSPMDVWYRFTTPATGGASTSATITVAGFPAGQVRLFSAASCSGPLTQLACTQNPAGPAAPLSYTALTPSTTYYVMVAGYADNSPRGQFSVCVTGAPACPDPTNLVISGLNATTASLAFSPSGNATSYTVTYTPQGGGTTTTLTATGSPVSLTNLTAGTTYTVTLQSICPAGTGSVLTRTYQHQGGAPANDDCAGATPVTIIGIGTCGSPVPGTIVGATPSTGVPFPGCAGYNVNTLDVWYSLVVPSNGVLQLETGPAATSSMNDTGLALYAGSCTGLTLLECDDDDSPNGGFSLIRRTNLTPGSTVYARVWKFGNTVGTNFTLCASTDAPCGVVSNLNVGAITSTTATLTFTPPNGATSYTVTYTPQGGNLAILTPSPTASPAVLTGLTPSTTYTVTIQASCPGGSGLPLALTLTTAPPPPANDDCAAPTALTVATTCTPVTATTVGATASAAPVPAPTCTTGAVNDVWFSLTVPANGIVQVSTGAVSGSPVTDTGLQLYAGSCGALTSLGCNDNFGAGNFSQVRATGLVPGSTVYARVWQVGSTNAGQFTICASTDPPCPAVTNLAVGSITTTSATLTFAPPAAGTSYTVSYTPTGGTATTLTPNPTSGPVNLTGLLPGTTYSVSVVSNCQPGETSPAATTLFTTTSCIAPTNLVVSAVTTTSATVSFGVGNGSSYTVTYTPQGGTATTVTPNPTGGPVTLTGLTPGTPYTVRITSNCGAGQSTTASTTFTTLTPCNPVTGLAAGSITTTSATLTFTPPAGAATYTVTYTASGGPAITITPSPNASPVQLTGLTPNTTYSVSITTQCSNGLSSAAATTSFTTLTPCNPVVSLTAGSITSTSAVVTFVPASPGTTSFTVTYTPQGGAPTTVTPAPAASPVTLSGLTPGTQYTVSVVSNCGGGQTSAPVSTIFFTPALPSCAAVTGLTASAVTPTSASLTFTGSGTSYTVTYTPQGGTATTVTPAPGGSPVALTGLTPNTSYTVSVISNCSNGVSSAATTTTFTTAALPTCAAPTGLTVSGVTSTTASVSFTPSSSATSYTATYTAAGGSPQTATVTGSTAALSGLQPNTTYTVSVVSNCAGGQTSPAATATFTTAALPTCAAVTGLTATAVSTTSATLTFTGAGAGATYTVTYTPQGGAATTVTPAPGGSPVALTGLTPNTPYSVSVVSNCSNGASSAAVTTTFTTLAPATCPPVTGLTVSPATTGATVSFVPGTGNTAYTVSVTPVGGGTPVTVSATGSPVTVTGLLPGTAYSACVTPSCGATSGAQVCITFTTATPTCPTPTNVAVGSVTATSASVSFAPNATATSYTVTYTRTGGAAQTMVVAGSPAALSGLTPNSQYTVSVASNCPNGSSSAASAAASFSTLVTATHNGQLARQVQLYPNPAQRSFWLELPAPLTRQAVTVTLINSIGQQVQQRTLPAAPGGSKVDFDVTRLPRGVYSLRLNTQAGVLVKRLVVD